MSSASGDFYQFSDMSDHIDGDVVEPLYKRALMAIFDVIFGFGN